MTLRYEPTTRSLWLSIGDLIATAFPGSLHLAPALRRRAAMGQAVHALHQSEQQAAIASYRAEVTIRHQCTVDAYTVHLQGRIDGLYEDGTSLVVEEIKSLLLPPEQFQQVSLGTYAAYEQQLALYVYLLQQQQEHAVRGHLVLVNLADDACRVLPVTPDSEAVALFIVHTARRILARCEARQTRASRRQASAQALHFPYPTLRPQQEAMMQQVRLALQDQSCVLLSAPTGIGKTVAALYPAVQHALQHGLRVFFVTARTTQQTLAASTVQQLARPGVQLTAVHLRAKEKSCLNEIYYCHESVCAYAQDYAGKLERGNVLAQLLDIPLVGPSVCAEMGQRYQVCPFELSLDVALDADVIIGDYNYVFDPGTYLRRFFQDTSYDDCVLIIDEAHNLAARGREYYSPALRQSRVRQLLVQCAAEPIRLFQEFAEFFQVLDGFFPLLHDSTVTSTPPGAFTQVSPPLEGFAALREQLDTLMVDYAMYRRRTGQLSPNDPLQDFYYAWQHLCDVLALGGEEFSYLYRADPEDAVFKVLCKDAARFLQARLKGFHSVIAMSATLTPFAFYQDVLGLPPERTFTAEFPSPFPTEHRKILIIPDISTLYRERQRDAPQTARIIDTIVAQRPGNYAAFFPSFAYMRLVRTWLQTPSQQLLVQTESMAERDRAVVLRRLRQGTEPTLLLAVQGGIFAEGVDYPGDMLIGVLVVGPGLPRVDVEQELLRAYYEDKYGRGFAYAYLYPGMNRVIQAAGRVIRSDTDVGIIVLLDKRFAYSNYSALLPAHWYSESPSELLSKNYQQALARFWRQY